MSEPTLQEFTRASFKIGCLGFGGPAGQIALMHRIFVEEKKWIDEERYLHALNFCMLLPGPEAQQLATYVGWLKFGLRGALIGGILFVLPGALVVLALAWAYALNAHVPLVQAALLGVKAAVLALVIEAMLRIGRRAFKPKVAPLVALASFAALYVFQAPFPIVILAAALFGAFFLRPQATPEASERRPIRTGWSAFFCAVAWLAPLALSFLLLGPNHVLTEIGKLFSVLALVTFGGAYATLAYLQQAAVETQSWLSTAAMIDALGLAETTPGPLVLVNQFVGFLAGWKEGGALLAIAGAAMASWCTFAPSFVWILAGAPYAERLRSNRSAAGALSAITAAVLGIIAQLAVWFAAHVLFADVERVALAPGLSALWPDFATFNWTAALLGILAGVALFRFKVGVLALVLGAAALGMVLSLI
ncbi:MAG: chromate efflux transporter [Hyphomonadaceae bacterium]|nr:chromate efflux transporter [Hyphomonadaceae bacterium]